MLVSGIGSSTVTPRATRQPGATAPNAAAPSESRALIPVTATTPSERTTAPSHRPLAAFLAHLIATQTQAPQTRTRRRVEPEEAMAVYGAKPALLRAGRRLSTDA